MTDSEEGAHYANRITMEAEIKTLKAQVAQRDRVFAAAARFVRMTNARKRTPEYFDDPQSFRAMSVAFAALETETEKLAETIVAVGET